MNKDQAKGRVRKVKGMAEAAAGKVLRKPGLTARGRADQAAGTTQAAFGDLKAGLKKGTGKAARTARKVARKVAGSPPVKAAGRTARKIATSAPVTAVKKTARKVTRKAR